MRISKIHLKGVGVFDDETIEFLEKKDPNKAEIHIFTGENGTGKSTLLYALSTITSNTEILNPSLILSRLHAKENSVRIGFEDLYDSEEKFQHINDIAYINYNGTLNYEGAWVFESPLRYYFTSLHQWSETGANMGFFAYSGYRQMSSFNIKKIEELDVAPLKDSLNFQKSINSEVFIQWLANTATKEALESNRSNSNKAGRYKESIERISEVVSHITGLQIGFYLESDPLSVKVIVNGKTLTFDVLPDGLKSIISWIGDLLMRLDRMKWVNDTPIFERNFILFLDEIEVHLHPAWQRKILPVVQKLFPNAQIFISTHSPFVVGSVEGAYVHKLVLKDGVAHAEKPRLTRTGESLSLILDEVFGIEDEFDLETENEFKAFYELRDEILKGNVSHEKDFLTKAKNLALKSEEVRNIVGREIRQVNRLAKKDYVL